MIEESNNLTEENEPQEINHTTENLKSVGQMIIGELEAIGGILTADPVSRAEGEFAVDQGILHQEANKNLTDELLNDTDSNRKS